MVVSCPIAGNELIQRHLRSSVNEREAIYECDYCTQKFKAKNNLIYHEYVHQLNQHERKDTDKPFVCVVCGMRFGEKIELDLHRDIHLEENIQKCNHCGKRYKYEEHLQRHERIHEWVASLDDVFDCNDSELIFQSDVVDESPTDSLPSQHTSPPKLVEADLLNIQPKKVDVSTIRKSTEDYECFAISVSSKTNSNIDQVLLNSAASKQIKNSTRSSLGKRQYNLRSKDYLTANREIDSQLAHEFIESKKDIAI